jgi:molybdopterin synthase sulfur carrier subunit
LGNEWKGGKEEKMFKRGFSDMPVSVRVPTPLRKFTNGADQVDAQGKTVADLVNDMEKRFPGIKERICDEEGQVRRFVNIYVNGDDIRFLKNLDTTLKEGDELSIIPAIAGGKP